jgi:hypothetical protein
MLTVLLLVIILTLLYLWVLRPYLQFVKYYLAEKRIACFVWIGAGLVGWQKWAF